MDSPKTFDKYYLQFDRDGTDGNNKRDTGDDMLNFNNENSLGGDNLYRTKNLQFNAITPRINLITPGDGTTITGKIRTVSGTSAGGNESSFIDKGYESVEINDTTRLSSPRIIASEVNEEDKLTAMGISFLFAGTEKDDPTKLHAVMRFDSMDVLKQFGADEALTEIRREAGAVIESGVMTIISDDFFTNYPEAFVKN